MPYSNKALPAGAVVREWRLEEVLGVGGFGIVYRGRGVYFDELVAIKEYFPGAISDRRADTTVSPNDSDSEELYSFGLSKFLEKAKVLWNLSKPERHPNIVSVRSLFETHGTAYMVMDFESGVSLSSLIKSGHVFTEANLLALIRPIALGLERAHNAGVLHRDIKPANILVDDTGRPVLIDFGSARLDSGQATSTKVTFYTPPYAALEQYVKTYPQGPWTDIYALGVTMYECIAGKKPPEVLERLHGDLDEPLSAKTWPGYSPALIRAVDAAMAIKPADRPQSIAQWLRMLDAPSLEPEEATRVATFRDIETLLPEPAAATAAPVAEARETSKDPLPSDVPAAVYAPTAVKPKSNVGLIAGGAAVVLLLAGAAALVGMRPKPAAPQAPAVTAEAAPVAPTGETAQAQSPALAALDGLISAAQGARRPASEIAALQAGRTQLAAMTDTARIDPLAEKLARAQATALTREVGALAGDMHAAPSWSPAGAGPVADAARAESEVAAAAAKVRSAADGVAAIQAAQAALGAHGRFKGALENAKPVVLAAQRNAFTTLETSTHQLANELIALGDGKKPWALASRAQKDRYDKAVQDAALARTRAAELTSLANAANGASELRSITAAMERVGAIHAELQGLKASLSPPG